MDSKYYCNVLQDCLIDKNSSLVGEAWILQQDKAAIHTFSYAKEWLVASDVDVMDWPPKSADFNIIKNVWDPLELEVYQCGRQFDNVYILLEAIISAWNDI